MSKQVKFEDLFEQVKKPLMGSEQLSIWGGVCPENKLLDFIKGWPLEQMSCRIWEYTDRIRFKRDELPPSDDVLLLERGRLFGEGGDFELRRDGGVFRWRFIGKLEIRPPTGYDDDKANFWTAPPDVAFHCYEETALLWGERDSDHWHDNRVAAADLSYPVDGKPERVQVEYKVYSRAGQVEFVWLTRLIEWKEESGGKGRG